MEAARQARSSRTQEDEASTTVRNRQIDKEQPANSKVQQAENSK
jgi:hypothetical protein